MIGRSRSPGAALVGLWACGPPGGRTLASTIPGMAAMMLPIANASRSAPDAGGRSGRDGARTGGSHPSRRGPRVGWSHSSGGLRTRACWRREGGTDPSCRPSRACSRGRPGGEDAGAGATSWSQRIFTRPGWRHGRLTAIESELADLGHIDLRRIPLPERSRCLQRDRSRTSGLSSRLRQTALGRADAGEVPAWWADRLAEIAAPPLPGRDAGLGMDLGL